MGVSVQGRDRISYRKLRALVKDQVSPLHPDEMRELGWEPTYPSWRLGFKEELP